MSNTLTMRSKITVRWTTNPADMGYDGRPSDWKNGKGETMSIRKAAAFAYALNQRVGQGTYKLIQYTHGGRAVTLDEINTVLYDWEYAREQRRHG